MESRKRIQKSDNKKSKALEDLRLRREGKQRVQDYKLKDDKIYDVVSEDQYAKIIDQRRNDQDWIVEEGDQGFGYNEFDEDDVQIEYDKQKGENNKKRKNSEVDNLDQSASITKLFMKAAKGQNIKAAKKPRETKPMSDENFMSDILGGLDDLKSKQKIMGQISGSIPNKQEQNDRSYNYDNKENGFNQFDDTAIYFKNERQSKKSNYINDNMDHKEQQITNIKQQQDQQTNKNNQKINASNNNFKIRRNDSFKFDDSPKENTPEFDNDLNFDIQNKQQNHYQDEQYFSMLDDQNQDKDKRHNNNKHYNQDQNSLQSSQTNDRLLQVRTPKQSELQTSPSYRTSQDSTPKMMTSPQQTFKIPSFRQSYDGQHKQLDQDQTEKQTKQKPTSQQQSDHKKLQVDQHKILNRQGSDLSFQAQGLQQPYKQAQQAKSNKIEVQEITSDQDQDIEVEDFSIKNNEVDAQALGDGSLPFYFIDAHEQFRKDGSKHKVIVRGLADLQLNKKQKVSWIKKQRIQTYAKKKSIYLFGKVLRQHIISKMSNPNQSPLSPAMTNINSKFQDGLHVSCCVEIKETFSYLYFIPKPHVFEVHNTEIQDMQDSVKAGTMKKKEFLKKLHQMAGELKTEIQTFLKDNNVKNQTIKPVERSYCFEDSDIPRRKQWVLKVKFSNGSQDSLDEVPKLNSSQQNTKGRHFEKILGINQSPLELLQIKRAIKGPQWIVIQNPNVRDQPKISWCKSEVEVQNFNQIFSIEKLIQKTDKQQKNINFASESPQQQPPQQLSPKTPKIDLKQEKFINGIKNLQEPPLNMMSISTKYIYNIQSKQNELVLITLMYGKNYPDRASSYKDWENKVGLQETTIIRRPQKDFVWPCAFNQNVQQFDNEYGMLNKLLALVQNVDVDIFIGHNIGAHDIPLILQRCQSHKNLRFWDKMGRLRRERWPNINSSGGGNMYGGGANYGVLQILSGRLIADSYVASKELLKESEYSLSALSKSILKIYMVEIAHENIFQTFQQSQSLQDLIQQNIQQSWLQIGLLYYLNFIPLTKLQSNLSGSMWSLALQGRRAQRIEILLLHEFHALKYLLPDKSQANSNKLNESKLHSDDVDMENEEGTEGEYNICFSTVERPQDESIPQLPEDTQFIAPLPALIKKFITERQIVKKKMSSARNPVVKEQLNIKQKAIKLTANSIYGCLGFKFSRFFARPIAELITSQGRQILQSAVRQVETLNSKDLKVIYGDTDSIMIKTNTVEYQKALDQARDIKKKINQSYTLLEIDLDAVFKSLLLLKKKKYAAVKIEPSYGFNNQITYNQVIEKKGLDIVRRDWCQLAKELGQKVLEQILSGQNEEIVVEYIHQLLRDLRTQIDNQQVPFTKFIITKQLTKAPEKYPDAKSQPHVQAALRHRQSNPHQNLCQQGDFIHYIICTNLDADNGVGDDQTSGEPKSKRPKRNQDNLLASRAYHKNDFEKLRKENKVEVDYDYYLENQVHPVVSRLCGVLTETNDKKLALMLGLDQQKYKEKITVGTREEFSNAIEEQFTSSKLMLEDDQLYKNCLPLKFKVQTSNHTTQDFEFQGLKQYFERNIPNTSVKNLFQIPDDVQQPLQIKDNIINKAENNTNQSQYQKGEPANDAISNGTITGAQFFNQTIVACRKHQRRYYNMVLRSDDTFNKYFTRHVNTIQKANDSNTYGTKPIDSKIPGQMYQVFNAKHLYMQLTSYYRQLQCHPASELQCKYIQKRHRERNLQQHKSAIWQLQNVLETPGLDQEKFIQQELGVTQNSQDFNYSLGDMSIGQAVLLAQTYVDSLRQSSKFQQINLQSFSALWCLPKQVEKSLNF